MIPAIVSEWNRVNQQLAVNFIELKEAEARFIRLLEVKEYDEERAIREQPNITLK